MHFAQYDDAIMPMQPYFVSKSICRGVEPIILSRYSNVKQKTFLILSLEGYDGSKQGPDSNPF